MNAYSANVCGSVVQSLAARGRCSPISVSSFLVSALRTPLSLLVRPGSDRPLRRSFSSRLTVPLLPTVLRSAALFASMLCLWNSFRLSAAEPPSADPFTLAMQAATNVLDLTTNVLQPTLAAAAGARSNTVPSTFSIRTGAATPTGGSNIRTAAKPQFADPAASLASAVTNVLRLATNVAVDNRSASFSTRTNATASVSQTGATSVQSPGLTNSMEALDDKHILAIGDRLSFRIEEDQEGPKPLVVADSGELEVPYLGRFPAENKTCKQLARELKTALEKEYYYQATVIIAVDLMAKSRGKVYLVGPVRIPGPQEIPSDEVLTLSKAILRAGGFTDFADKKNVKITRRGALGGSEKQTLLVNVAQILEKGKTEQDVPLQPGDLIYIPERTIRF